MILAVIADDLTGAAELAAAAAAMGYTSEVHTAFDTSSDAEVICVDTDTRALPPPEAARRVADVTQKVLNARPRWLFKKTDSVLRGNVRAETESMLNVSDLQRALLVPANPSKERVIREGVYYVNGVPLAQTAFAADPDHPRRTSHARDLLGESPTTPDRIAIPDAVNESNIQNYAAALGEGMLPAGGVDFFVAVLNSRAGSRHSTPPIFVLDPPALFCSGSLQAWRGGCASECAIHGIPVMLMPEGLFSRDADSSEIIQSWTDRIIDAVTRVRCVMATIGDGGQSVQSLMALTTRFANVVGEVLHRQPIATLCIEGGATAAAVLKVMGWTRLVVVPVSDLTGVAVLRAAGTHRPTILVKPGSYPWPARIWH